MAKRKARSVWVWHSGVCGLITSDCLYAKPRVGLRLNDGDSGGYVEFREVLPKKGKVNRGKK